MLTSVVLLMLLAQQEQIHQAASYFLRLPTLRAARPNTYIFQAKVMLFQEVAL